jgi:hypothetical protein
MSDDRKFPSLSIVNIAGAIALWVVLWVIVWTAVRSMSN